MKDLIVHLDGSEQDETRLAHAESLASRHDAFLTGLLCNVLPDVMIAGDAGYPATQVVVELQNTASEAGDKKQNALVERFRNLGVLNELRRVDAYASQAGHAMTLEARTADLFVATRPYGNNQTAPEPIESVLFHSGRACLFVPPSSTPTPFKTVVVAWRNTQEAARAVAEALPILKAADQVILAIVSESEAPEQGGTSPGADIARHLDRHGISAEVRELSGWSDPAEALLNEVQKSGADLLVMGGYGHSRFREWVLGGVTRQILTTASIPVLMAH